MSSKRYEKGELDSEIKHLQRQFQNHDIIITLSLQKIDGV